jgi:peroxiredoxin
MRAPALIAAVFVTTFPALVAAESLDGKVTVKGSIVEVLVRHEDGRPAAGVGVRLLYGRQLTVASAHTDGDGRWTHVLTKTGAYEALIETGATPADAICLPFTALENNERPRFPWCEAALGGVSMLAAILLGVALLRNLVGGIWTRPIFALSGGLLLTGVGLLGWSVWVFNKAPAMASGSEDDNIAGEARDFLRGRDVKPLSGSLERLLADASVELVKSQPHPLLGQKAPDFELIDHLHRTWRLSERLSHGPVVLIFYFGYHCNHCVGQLFAVQDDIAKFTELGVEVVAISADPPELTWDRFAKYGEFAFPVLTDPKNGVAAKYGVFIPASGIGPSVLKHGTFVIGRDGRIVWAHCGNDPFTGNVTLLHELARSEGRLPGTPID